MHEAGPAVAPPGAATILGDALPVAESYARLLTGPGVVRGLIGPAEAGRIWSRHILNCAILADLVPDQCSLADLGSGAGLPGLVLAMLRPRARITLVEPMARRVAFLHECIGELDLTSVRVVRGRAEDLTGQLGADIVTARAVAPLARLAGWAAGLCRPGGLVLAVKGAGAAAEVSESRVPLRQLGARDVRLLRVGSDRVDPPVTVVRFVVPRPPVRGGSDAGPRAGSRRPDRRRGPR